MRLTIALVVTAWLAVCGQTCAEAGTAGSANGFAAVGGAANALAGGKSDAAALPHLDNHGPRGGREPACDASACCAKMASSDHATVPIPASRIPPPAPDTLLYTLPVAVSSRGTPARRPKPIPTLSVLQRTSILRI